MRQSHKFLEAIDMSFYRRYGHQMLIMVGLLLFFMFSRQALANPFATPNDFRAESCPSGHKKYNIANNASTDPSLSFWESGEELRTFTFNENSGSKVFTISFSDIEDIYLGNGRSESPFYDSLNGVTSSAITLSHISTTVKTNHSLTVQVDRSVSKIGYKIQDLDSTGSSNQIPYIEEAEAFNNGRLTYSPYFHEITNNSKVTGRAGRNCSLNECNIDATWPYSTANSPVVLKHRNTRSDRGLTSTHSVGYSDFYFCLAPPKIIVNKLLDGSRVDGDDQFRIELQRTDNNAFVEAFTTTGSNDVVTDNTTTVTTLTEGVNYTVSEQIINGNLLDYQTTYTCSNATTGTDVVFSSGEMPVNADGTRRTFAINNVSYGDEITCNVTNTPSQYTFSGTVFNDNGGISSNDKFDTSSTFTGNSAYFNGIYDRSVESGINDINVQIRLTNCSDTTYATTSINEEGKYSFSFPSNFISVGQSGCVVQDEPNEWTYSVDTTANEIPITITEGNYTYDNLNFGEVQINNTALVLEKQQYVHDCSATLNYSSILDNETDPSLGFSEVTAKVDPGQCIAYKITATNRGNIVLNNIVISDTLQKEGVDGATVTSTLADAISTADGFATDRAIGYNGTITTQPFSLNKEAPRSFYFNTQYGTSNSNTP